MRITRPFRLDKVVEFQQVDGVAAGDERHGITADARRFSLMNCVAFRRMNGG